MALAKAKSDSFSKARQIVIDILQTQLARFGPESEQVIETTGLLGYLHIKEVDLEDALKCLQVVEQWQSKNLTSCHPAVRTTKETIKAIEKCMEGRASVWI